jgi:predicted RNA-binding Zn ribbon-like protein
VSITDIPTAVADPAGRKPAPGRLGVVQAFLNTVPLRTGGPDLLGDRRAAIGWFRAVGILPTDPVVVTSSEHANLLRLRELLRAVLMTRTAGRRDEPTAANLTRAFADGRLVLTVDAGAGAHWKTAARAPYPSMVAGIAIAIAESVTSGTWPYLKACATPGCGWAFYEDSAATNCSGHG